MIVDGQVPIAPCLQSCQCFGKTVFQERSCKEKRVDTRLKTISKKVVTAIVVVFQIVIHFSHIHTGFICVSFIRQSMVSGVFGRKEKRGKEWFLCFGFDCAFSTTLTLKNPFLLLFSSHTQ